MQPKQVKLNHSIEKCIQIIETMANDVEAMRLQDIAERTGLPASTALRMISTLQSLGYINQDPNTLRYSLTLKFAQLGNRVTSQVSIRDIAHPFLVELSKRCSESVCLAQEQDMEVVYIDVFDGPDNMLKITQYIGKRAPMHCTGIGKMILLNYTDEQLEEIIKQKGLPSLTTHTIGSIEELKSELDRVRQCGYALDDEECEIGVRCIATGIHDYTGKVVCGISISGPVSRMTMKRIQEIVPDIKHTAEKISKLLAG